MASTSSTYSSSSSDGRPSNNPINPEDPDRWFQQEHQGLLRQIQTTLAAMHSLSVSAAHGDYPTTHGAYLRASDALTSVGRGLDSWYISADSAVPTGPATSPAARQRDQAAAELASAATAAALLRVEGSETAGSIIVTTHHEHGHIPADAAAAHARIHAAAASRAAASLADVALMGEMTTSRDLGDSESSSETSGPPSSPGPDGLGGDGSSGQTAASLLASDTTPAGSAGEMPDVQPSVDAGPASANPAVQDAAVPSKPSTNAEPVLVKATEKDGVRLVSSEGHKSPYVSSGSAEPDAGEQTLETFEDIYLDLSTQPGRCRLADSGIGWKPAKAEKSWTLDKSELISAQWSRAARGYELRMIAKNQGVIQLDGFKQDDLDSLQKCFKVWYGIELLQKEHALRGWNWGKSEMSRNELTFNVRNQPAFEIPYAEISNTNLAGKNEVAVEFSLPSDSKDTGTNGALGGARGKGKKGGAAVDQLTEMRFYIPGTENRKVARKEDANSGDDSAPEEETNAANIFYESLMDKAQIGEVAGDTYATFLDILHLTPRGRFDIDLYETSFRLRGKTYDYKIAYESAKKFFLLPKPDDVHQLICIGLDPPLRQGQTRYPFLVMQHKRDEEVNVELNMTEQDLQEKFNGKLQPVYEAPIANVITKILHGLTGKRITQPSHDFVSHHSQSGVKCSIKANEGHLFCLDRAFLFVPKPATYISFENISVITMSRVGGAVSASRTFDITVTLKNGMGEHQFSNINREEQQPLEQFFKTKGLKTKNEMDADGAMLKAAMVDPDLQSSEDEAEVVRQDRGSADEDDESVDEDFQADSESDVAEEFDSDAKSSGGGSDAEMEDASDGEGGGDAGGSGSDTAEKVERPKKKAKTG